MENYLKKSIAAMYGLTPSIVESRNHKMNLQSNKCSIAYNINNKCSNYGTEDI